MSTRAKRTRSQARSSDASGLASAPADLLAVSPAVQEAVPAPASTSTSASSLPPVTPARWAGGASPALDAKVMNTPTRATRLEEKTELQSLNKRLEYYILFQRERDASTAGLRAELDSLREKSRQDIVELRTMYESQLGANVHLQENLSSELARFKDEAGRLAREIAQLRAELKKEVAERQDLESRLKQRNAELRDTQTRLLTLEDEHAAQAHELQADRDALKHARASLEQARKEAAAASERLVAADSRVANLKADLSMVEDKFKQELDHYKREVAALNKERATVEDDLRREFGNQLKDILAERQMQSEQEKEELAAELKRAADEAMTQYVADMQAMRAELADGAAAKTTVDKALAQAKANTAQALAQRDAANATIEALQKQLEEEGEQHRGQVALLTARFKELREMFQRKEEDFNELMDVKITLALEIKAYRALLENEESRMGVASPAQRRLSSARGVFSPAAGAAHGAGAAAGAGSGRRRGGSMPRGEEEGEEEEGAVVAGRGGKKVKVDATSTVLITGMDIDARFLKVRNGSTEAVSLKGWTLKSRRNHFKFEFPARVLQPAETVTIFMGKDAAKSVKGGNELAWTEDNIFHPGGDSVQLVDGLGRVVSTVDVISR